MSEKKSLTYKAVGPSALCFQFAPYDQRNRRYLNSLTWDKETEYLAVYVNDVEVQFELWSDGSIVYLTKQPEMDSKVVLQVEDIPELEEEVEVEG